MKKYNLSKIMKRAWELVKKAGMTISSGLKKSWEEAKMTISKIVKFNVTGNETFTVDTATGEFSGKTYNSKDWIKRNFSAKWNREEKKWVADPEEVKAELSQHEDYYKKYIVGSEESGKSDLENDEIIDRELVNKWDGFYAINIHKSGKISWSFIG